MNIIGGILKAIFALRGKGVRRDKINILIPYFLSTYLREVMKDYPLNCTTEECSHEIIYINGIKATFDSPDFNIYVFEKGNHKNLIKIKL